MHEAGSAPQDLQPPVFDSETPKVPSLAKDVGVISIGEVGSRAPLLALEAFLLRVFTPAEYGLWAIAQIAANYNNFSHLGVVSAYGIEEPKAKGAKNEERVKALASTTFTAVLGITLVITALALAVAFFFPRVIPGGRGVGLSFVASLCWLLFTQQVFIFYQSAMQNRLMFGTLSSGRIAYATMALLSVIALAPWLRIEGAILGWGVGFASGAMLCARAWTVPRMRFKFDLLMDLFRLGVPIFLAGLLKLALSTFDRFMIVGFNGSRDLGFYNVGVVWQSLVILIGVIGAKAYMPRLMHSIGEEVNSRELALEFIEGLEITCVAIAIGTSLLAMTLAPTIWHFVPEYLPGLFAAVILLLAGYFHALSRVVIVYNLAQGQEKALPLINFVGLALGLAAAVMLSRDGLSLEEMALVSASAWLVVAVAYLVLAVRTGGFEMLRSRVVVSFVRPTLVLLIVVPVAFRLQLWIHQALPQGVLRIPVDAVAGTICMLPLLGLGLYFFRLGPRVHFLASEAYAAITDSFERIRGLRPS